MTPGVAAASWPFVEEFIKKAVHYAQGDYTEKFIGQELAQGRMQLWASFDEEHGLVACVVTSLEKFPAQNVCFIHCLAGDLEAVYALEPSIIAWAKANGAKALEGWGRPGFSKVLPPGWKEIHRIYRKYLGN